jgi:NAD(P)-dependent dehydrogenase (short-subunit alcohol dehydrogenase family)
MVSNSVAVVTGGCTPAGLATAKRLARDHHVVLSDSSCERLTRSLDELDSLGVSAESIVADVTDRGSVAMLMAAARSAGHVAVVVHADGGTQRTDGPEAIVRGRVLGTINVTAQTLAVAGPGTTLVHLAPHEPGPLALPRWLYRLAPREADAAVEGLARLAMLGPARLAPSAAHALSAMFLDWYTARMTEVFHAAGARLCRATSPEELGWLATPAVAVSRAA